MAENRAQMGQYAAETRNTRTVKQFKPDFSNSLTFTIILSAAAKSAKIKLSNNFNHADFVQKCTKKLVFNAKLSEFTVLLINVILVYLLEQM